MQGFVRANSFARRCMSGGAYCAPQKSEAM
jgi:hypothetical protein